MLGRRFRQTGDDHTAALFQKMDTQINKLTHLITDLLDVTKIESGHLLFEKTTFEWNELIKEIVEETQLTTTRHRIALELSSPITVSADRDRVGQVLTNLLTNAIKYSPQAFTIIVKTVLTENAILTSVQDFGIGIAKEKQAHLFERFFRVDGDTQQTYPGLGLGLYISSEFIKRHHGSIWLESNEGEGTTITFSLPLHPNE
jgi:signal transduction histidine kinase